MVALLMLGFFIAALGVSGIITIKERQLPYYCARLNTVLGVMIVLGNGYLLLK